MIPTRVSILTAVLALVAFGNAGAQGTFTVRPESRVILLGRSNINSWSCATSTFEATIATDSSARRDADPSLARRTMRLTVRVPVRSLNCGRKRMNEDMYRALTADEFPDINYVLDTYVVDSARAASDSFTVRSVGELTVAGTTKMTEFRVWAARDSGGGLRGQGIGHLLMTDFGIKPPTALLGTIRVKNALVVRVEILVTRATLVTATRLR